MKRQMLIILIAALLPTSFSYAKPTTHYNGDGPKYGWDHGDHREHRRDRGGQGGGNNSWTCRVEGFTVGGYKKVLRTESFSFFRARAKARMLCTSPQFVTCNVYCGPTR